MHPLCFLLQQTNMVVLQLQNQESTPIFKSNHYADLYFVFGGYAKKVRDVHVENVN
jgi:hypothetical protein